MTPTKNNVEPTTSATERLRALLDERGVEYRVSATGYSIDIGPNVTAYANRTDTTLDVSLRGFTPEQAVAATQGPGTCEVAESADGYGWYCECGNFFPPNVPPRNYCPNCGRRVVND